MKISRISIYRKDLSYVGGQYAWGRGNVIDVGNDAATDIERIRTTMSILKPGENAYADANQGWTIHEAIEVVRAVADLNVMIEQPCQTYEECLHVRAHTNLPMKLDECVTDIRVAEDTWGGEITTAALAHFAASTPPELLYNTTDLHNYNVETTGMPGPATRDGKLFASDSPGLGVEPDLDSLGDPVAIYD